MSVIVPLGMSALFLAYTGEDLIDKWREGKPVVDSMTLSDIVTQVLEEISLATKEEVSINQPVVNLQADSATLAMVAPPESPKK